MRNSEYSKVKASIESGEKLDAFRQKLDVLKQEWITGLDETYTDSSSNRTERG